MTTSDTARVDLATTDQAAARAERLRDLVPEAFVDDRLDLERVALAVGMETETGSERYGLTWAGEGDAIRALQIASVASLSPTDKSSDFDVAKNAFVVGDSLEVLKLLQKAYNDQVRLIYLDPPYNTTKDFIYNDDFTDSLRTYLEYTGQLDGEGKMVSATAETSGRRHSGWLSFMYPRLALARNLLARDGLIFVSIDDNEVHNLRHLMDEVYGQENWLATLVWNRGHSQQQGIFKEYHEYVLVYGRDAKSVAVFRDPAGGDIIGGALKRVSRANPESEFTFPPGVRCEAPDGTEFTGTWGAAERVRLISGQFRVRGGLTRDEVTLAAGWTQKDQMRRLFAGEMPVYDTRGQEVAEFFFSSSGKLKYKKARTAFTPPTVQDWGTQGAASAALDALVGPGMFDRPKPVKMIQDIVAWTTSGDDVVLDFFAGSGTTGHAVLQQNVLDGGDRRFILINLPEVTPEDSAARAAGFQYVTDVAIHRLGRAAASIDGSDPRLRCYELSKSSFQIWDSRAAPAGEHELAEALTLFANNLPPGAMDSAIASEVFVKEGVRLDARWEHAEAAGSPVVVAGDVAVSLARESSAELVRAMQEIPAARIVAIDSAFAGRDKDKSNLAAGLAKAGRALRTV